MIRLITTACVLICDSCKREFCHEKRHVFKTQSQAMILAEQYGWNVNFQSDYAICPKCNPISNDRYGVREVRAALATISRTYFPQVGEKDNKSKMLYFLVKELKADPSDCDLLWKTCIENNLVWYDEYSGIYRIRL